MIFPVPALEQLHRHTLPSFISQFSARRHPAHIPLHIATSTPTSKPQGRGANMHLRQTNLILAAKYAAAMIYMDG